MVSANDLFAPAAPPPTALGRYRRLGPNCGLKVSPLCIGAMNFGTAWKEFMGEFSKDACFDMLDHFWKAGGNFIDTANAYQEEESETWIGDWMKARGNREEMVVATKYSTLYRRGMTTNASFAGNSYKNLVVSCDASLKKLQTDYIDIMYVHWWDHTTPVEEVMQGLNNLVRAGKVLYLGISDTPAWIVAKANMYARQHGLAQFVVYQGRWNAADRSLEQEVLPMARDFGMGIAPWAAIGGGNFKTEAQLKQAGGRNMGGPSENDIKVSKVLEKIANTHKTGMTSVALAYVMEAYPYTFPIVGGRKVEHLKSNIEALELKLSREEMEEIEGAYGFQYGFPEVFAYSTSQPSTRLGIPNVVLLQAAMAVDEPPRPRY